MAFSDDFNRAPSATIGNGWTQESTKFEILSNQLRATGGGAFSSNKAIAPAAADFQDGTVTVDFNTDNPGSVPQIFCRLDNPSNNGYILYYLSNSVVLTSVTGGGLDGAIDTAAYTMTASTNYRWTLTASGSTLTGVLRNLDTATDVATVTGTRTTYPNSGSTAVSINATGTIDYDNFTSTGSGADTDPPNVTLPTATSITGDSVVLGATTDEANGTAHAIITANGNQSLPINQEIIDGNAPEELFEAVDLTISAAGAFTFAAITGLDPSTTYGYAIVHEDTAGNEDVGSRVEGTFTTLALPTITTAAFKNNTGTSVTGKTGLWAQVLSVANGSVVATKTALSQEGDGTVIITDAAMSAATNYIVVVVDPATNQRHIGLYTSV